MTMTRRIKRVAFIGTGIMGSAIAMHILTSGYALTVYTRTKEKAQELLDAGAAWAASPLEAAESADVVFTMLGYPEDVEEVYLSQNGLLRLERKGVWLIDLTTSSPELARDIHDAAEVADLHAFDCPVTGGEAGAKAATLTLIAGITESEAAPVKELLSVFSSKIFYFDKPGAGQIAKLCNQVSLISCMTGLCDAMALADLSGIDVPQMLEVLSLGTGGSNAQKALSSKILAEDWRPGFFVEHLKKDIKLALDCADELDIALPGADTGYNLLDVLCKIGGSRMGTQAYALLYKDDEVALEAGLDWLLLKDDQDDTEGL